MNDLIPIAIFIGCVLATFGFVRLCQWLRPTSVNPPAELGGASPSTTRHEEAAR